MSTPTKALNLLSKSKALSPLSQTNIKNLAICDEFRASWNYTNYDKSVKSAVARTLKPPTVNEKNLLINSPEKIGLQAHGLEGKKNLKILGQGSFGNVVSGKYNDNHVAVKVVKLKGKDKTAGNRDINALTLNHKNIVRTLDVIIRSNCDFGIVIMEYIPDSESLHEVLINKPEFLTKDKIKRYAVDICNGLRYCHKNNILHLDVKPSNILVCWNEICKLCDFGNSMKVDQEIYDNYFNGTPAYTAPEIFLGKTPTTKSDIYSLGIILWQMRQKQIPYKHITCPEVIIYKVVKFGMRPEEKYTDEDEFSRLYRKCWATEAYDRPTIHNVIEVLLEKC